MLFSAEKMPDAVMPPTDAAWKALEGAFDLQVHVAPDVIERRTDDLDFSRDFLKRGLEGFVLKSHYVPTAERAQVVARAVPGIAAYGAVTLNHAVSGLNPVAVEIAGRSGARIVWMPTVDAANETAGRAGGASTKLPFWGGDPKRALREGDRAGANYRSGRVRGGDRGRSGLSRAHR